MSITTRTAALVALASLSVFVVGIGAAALLVLFVLLLAAGDAVSVRRSPPMTRSTPLSVVRGQPSVVSAAVRIGVADVGYRDRSEGELRSVTSVEGRGSIPRRGHTVLRQPVPADIELAPTFAIDALDASLVALRRGRHVLAPLALRIDGPLRLGRWHHQVGEAVEVKAYPDVVAGHRIARAVKEGRFATAGRVTRGPLGLGTDFETVREYRPDDDVRQINWIATARTGVAMSNQFRIEQDRDVLCLVDLGRLMTAPIGQLTMADAAFDAMTAVVLTADELGDRSGLIAFDATIRTSVAPTRRAGSLLIEQAFALEPYLVDSDYAAAFQAAPSAKRSLAFVFTDLLDPAAAEPLIAALPLITRRHRVIIVAALPHLEPPDRDDRARAAVDASVAQARTTAKAMIESLGCVVAEASPDRLAIAAVEAYLRSRR